MYAQEFQPHVTTARVDDGASSLGPEIDAGHYLPYLRVGYSTHMPPNQLHQPRSHPLPDFGVGYGGFYSTANQPRSRVGTTWSGITAHHQSSLGVDSGVADCILCKYHRSFIISQRTAVFLYSIPEW